MKPYPFIFERNLKTLVWGTEEWTVSTIKGSESVIANGEYAGKKLNEVVGQLPLLAKIIDAHKDLSIQVHPDDVMANRVHNKLGKSEMWYVLDAEPGAYLYSGFKTRITPEEYKERVSNGTITEVLAKHMVKPGDIFYIPAGRVHAICGGIKLAEIQQSSDVTYRIYDYNRPGLDGKPRELHTELAAQAIDYTVEENYKTSGSELKTDFFTVNAVEITEPVRKNHTDFSIITPIKNDCIIKSSDTEVIVKRETSCFISKEISEYEIMPASDSCTVLEATL